MENIADKISSLGGIEEKEIEVMNSNLFIEFERKFNRLIPEIYKRFLFRFGEIDFKKDVCFSCVNPPPIAEKGIVGVRSFFGVHPASKKYIGNAIERRGDQFSNNFLPFCEGEDGDLIGFDMTSMAYGQILYWHHESPELEDLFVISDAFETFFLNLKNCDLTISNESVEWKPSDKLNELMKKFKGNT